ncbi:MAG TPA: glycosyl hydrolase family 18 protein, partial [Rhodothermales bacterium]
AVGCATTRQAPAPTDVPAPTTPAPAASAPLVSGYHVYWSNDAWEKYPFDVLDTVFFFDLEVGAEGRIVRPHGWPDRWLAMQRHAAQRGVEVVPVVSIMDATAFRQLFESESARAVLRDEIIALFEDFPETDGVQLDFEVFVPVPAGIRENVTAFVRDLDAAMQTAVPGKSLSMFLLAYDEADVFDEAALAEIVDYVIVQGYDLHARGDEQAGPVAATRGWGRRNWSFILERYRGLGVPLDHIVMAVPYFGYEWPTASEDPKSRTRGPGISMTLAPVDSVHGGSGRLAARTRADSLGLKRDAESGIPYYTHADSSGAFQGWFDDEESLASKYRFVLENGLRGVAIFPLAYGDERTHAPLRQVFGTP